jgi:hypothetical protein
MPNTTLTNHKPQKFISQRGKIHIYQIDISGMIFHNAKL